MNPPPNGGQPTDKIPRDRPIDNAAAELAKKRILPQPPGKKLSFEEMQEYFKLLTPEMWARISIYVYREYPRIIRQLKDPDAPKYIDCVSQPIDMEYMIEHHGGGKYNLFAVDAELTKQAQKGQRELFECSFEINASQHPPKLNYEELDVNHKANMAYVQLLQYKGILDGKGHPMTAQQPAAAGANPDVIKQVLDFVSKMSADQQEALRAKISPDEQSLSKSLGEIVLQRMQQDDPAKQLTGLLGIIKEVLNAKPATDGISLKDVLAMQNENNRTVFQLVEKLAEANRRPEPAANPQLDQFDQMLTILEKLNGFRGGRGGGERSGWDIGLDYFREGAPLLNGIINLFALNRNGRPIPMPPAGTAAAAAAAAGGAPVAFDPYANPAAMRAHASSMVAAQPPAANIPAPSAGLGGPSNDLTALIQNYGGLIVNALNNGTPGYAFADYVVGLLGVATHAQITAPGEAALSQALLTVPETALFGEGRLRTFVHEFVCYQEFLDQEEDTQDDNEPAAAAARGVQ